MVGGIKAVRPWVKSASEKLLMGLPTVLPPFCAQSTRDTLTQTRCDSVTVMVLVSSASGPRVSG